MEILKAWILCERGWRGALSTRYLSSNVSSCECCGDDVEITFDCPDCYKELILEY